MKKGTILRFTRDIKHSDMIRMGDKAIYLGDSQIRIITGTATGFVYSLLISAPIEIVSTPDPCVFCKNCRYSFCECDDRNMFRKELITITDDPNFPQVTFCTSFDFFDKDKYYGE